MNFEEKFPAFLNIAKVLNEVGIIPALYGSLGLYRIIGQIDEIDDIDIIIPNIYLGAEFPELVKIMESIGYHQDKVFPHEFTKGDGQIGFEPESDLNESIGKTLDDLKLTELDGVKFRELSEGEYLMVYKKDLERRKEKVKNTERKVNALEQGLNN